MGSKRITTRNLEVVRVDVENNVIPVMVCTRPKKSLVTLAAVKASKKFLLEGGPQMATYLFTILKDPDVCGILEP